MINENTKTGLLIAVTALTAFNTYVLVTDKGTGARETSAANINDPFSSSRPSTAASAANPFQTTPESQPAEAPSGPVTSISFAESSYDFGKIKQDTKNNHLFRFTNTGSEPLIIKNATGSCGCTVPKYPKEPIPPGGTGEIEVEYSPGKQQGTQAKTVTITANTEPAQTQLTISANVEEVK